MKTEKATTLHFGGIFKNRERASEMFSPDERQASPEALICLNCPLPECKKLVCERYNEEMQRIKEKGNG